MTYRGSVDVRTSWETATRSGERDVQHGYPPPRLPAGTVTTAYCGATMVVAGEYSDAPPKDACPLCALEWEQRHGG